MNEVYAQEFAEWMNVAKRDLRGAHKLNDGEDCPLVCYHCQQAAEKAVKALIICAGAPGGLPKKHDITFLLNQVKNYLSSSIPQEIKDAGNDLNQYATATRYPAEEEISQAEADQAIEEATAILQWVEREAEVM